MHKKNILLTGHSSGIGNILLYKLLEREDFLITAISRRSVKSHERLEQINCDLSDFNETKKLKHHLIKKHFDYIILNAGANNIKPAEAYNLEEIQKIIQLNFSSHALLFRICINGLIKKQGHVIAIGSYSGNEIKRWNNYYGAAKAAFHHFILNMFEQYRTQNVKFSLIVPEITQTPFYQNQDYKPLEDTKYSLNPTEIADFIFYQIILNEKSLYPLQTFFKPNFVGIKRINK